MGASEPDAGRFAPSSVEGMFRAHYGALTRSLAVVAGDVEVAADAVQEAFVRAHVRWQRIRSYDDPVAWVRRVALNRIYNHHRSVLRRRRFVARSGEPDPSSPMDEIRVDVATAVRRLPLKQRTAVVLHYLDDLPIAAVAEAMGVSQGTVKTHLSRARDAMRPVLEVES